MSSQTRVTDSTGTSLESALSAPTDLRRPGLLEVAGFDFTALPLLVHALVHPTAGCNCFFAARLAGSPPGVLSPGEASFSASAGTAPDRTFRRRSTRGGSSCRNGR